ncbi:uncharacterized protein L969DRAFT_95370 [Mixia osmundae IAM 14324]|uniref:CENP-V/GFA domain-containing protein n=1 Tax=Mixia osmundae (strain CBS 9802 / IAM 14324 / JCM 22182 / KY 12970) TaxID=764103 RepID=G7DZ64_MIXOS|nr:uncharacterized protein L969DRAFT_95370 [Mixia osmundae IAM 14324]KEI38275.1 hypothetical protein L969DRAFT_95370 [Mixia osmundae IAM 14324]GAA95874.1 hypothetical protein E5Q_02531 [Mixia osmundae IAM 14324]
MLAPRTSPLKSKGYTQRDNRIAEAVSAPMSSNEMTDTEPKQYFPVAGLASDGWSTDDEATVTCFCGGVQIVVPVQGKGFLGSFICNCADCHKLSASAHATNFTVLDSHLRYVRGKEQLKQFGQSDTIFLKGNKEYDDVTMTNHFCSVCGSLMFRTAGSFPGASIMRVGSVDDFTLQSTKLRPTKEQFTRDRVAWKAPTEGAEQFEGDGLHVQQPRKPRAHPCDGVHEPLKASEIRGRISTRVLLPRSYDVALQPSDICPVARMSRDDPHSKGHKYFPTAGLASDGWSSEDEATATCFCGLVQLVVPIQGSGFSPSRICNCPDCHKISGTVHSTNFNVQTSHVRFMRGEDRLTHFAQVDTVLSKDDGNDHTRTNSFCSQCGVLLYRSNASAPGIINIRLGTVDDFALQSTLRPTAEHFVRDRVGWKLPTAGAEQNWISPSSPAFADETDMTRSEQYFPIAGLAHDGWSTDEEATTTCFCGRVQLVVPIRGEGFLGARLCHCADCHKFTGSIHATNFSALTSLVRYNRGKDQLETFSQSQTMFRKDDEKTQTNSFCRTCGTLMYRFNSSVPDRVSVRVGTVDDFALHSTKLRPTVEIFTKDRVTWKPPTEGAQQFEAAPT